MAEEIDGFREDIRKAAYSLDTPGTKVQNLIRLAEFYSFGSPDPNTKVGALVTDWNFNEIISIGMNKLPGNIYPTPEMFTPEAKPYWMDHAERVALYQVPHNQGPYGMVVTLFPCADCVKAMIAKEVSIVYTPLPTRRRLSNPDWMDNFKVSLKLMQRGGIDLRIYDRTENEGLNKVSYE
jgi:deoxycytidylate deaminase